MPILTPKYSAISSEERSHQCRRYGRKAWCDIRTGKEAFSWEERRFLRGVSIQSLIHINVSVMCPSVRRSGKKSDVGGGGRKRQFHDRALRIDRWRILSDEYDR